MLYFSEFTDLLNINISNNIVSDSSNFITNLNVSELSATSEVKYLSILILFLLSFITITVGYNIIMTHNSIISILFLLILFGLLTLYSIILNCEFLALNFLIIYVGAVCVLMLIHIKLIKTFQIKIPSFLEDFSSLKISVFLLIFIVPLLNLFYLMKTSFLIKEEIEINLFDFNFDYINYIDFLDSLSNLQILAFFIYNSNFLYIIYASLILFIAMIGSILITSKLTKKNNIQKLQHQIHIDLVRVSASKTNFESKISTKDH